MTPISRRTVLKGAGAALALPVLDAMLPRISGAIPDSLVRNRMAFIYLPNGIIMQDWTPAKTGTDFELPRTLLPLQEHRQDLLVLSGLAHDKAKANGDGAGDHARDSAVFLTAVQPLKTAGADLRAGQSVDQVAAEQIGGQTTLPSLELGVDAGRQAGNCDSGYSCAYSSNISWKSAGTPTGKEIQPRAVFERLFGTGEDAALQARRAFYRQSILDFVADDAQRLRPRLGAQDRRKLDEYFTSVREVEQRLDKVRPPAPPELELPDEAPAEWAEHARLMYDLMALAFQTDSTRICTLMLGNSGSNRTYPEIGVKDAHHGMSHHRGDADKIAHLQKIDEHMCRQFAYFLSRLKEIREGEGTLLDHSMIMLGCSISDANRHHHNNLPILLAGRGNDQLSPGRHIQYGEDIPLANLFLSLLDRMGCEVERFGDSTGRLDQLQV